MKLVYTLYSGAELMTDIMAPSLSYLFIRQVIIRKKPLCAMKAERVVVRR